MGGQSKSDLQAIFQPNFHENNQSPKLCAMREGYYAVLDMFQCHPIGAEGDSSTVIAWINGQVNGQGHALVDDI